MRALMVVVLTAAVLGGSGSAVRAQGPQEEARELFLKGVEMADQQRWSEAVQSFRRSRALVDRPSTVFNLAVALLRLGRYGESLEAFDDFMGMTDPERDAEARKQAEQFMRQARTGRATLVLTVSPEAAVVYVDGERREGEGTDRTLVLDPGRHTLRIEAEGYLAQQLRLSMLSGSETSTAVELVPMMGDLGRQDQMEESRRRQAEAEARAEGRVDRSLTDAGSGSAPAEAGDERSVWKSPWLWVAAGAMLVGAGVGLGVGLSGGDGADPYGGTTGVVLRP